MLFVCGIIDRSGSNDHSPAVDAMVSSRKSARSAPVHNEPFPGGVLSRGSASISRVNLKSCLGLLLYPPFESRDTHQLEAIMKQYDASGRVELERLGGIFLLIIVDAKRKKTIIANDRFGICPLYYHAGRERIVFATDIDALAACPGVERTVDPQAVYNYMFFHCIPSPGTIYQGVRKLGPAGLVTIDCRSYKETRHWMPQFATADAGVDDLGSELLASIEQAVAERATNKCGCFLSGGLDSSTVAGMLHRARGSARTFTIGFDAAGYDESGFARVTADHFRTEQAEYFVTPADVRDSLPRIASHYGEPFGNSSVIPTFHCARFAREHGIAMLLAGDGGDELFAGNTRYAEQEVFEIYSRVPAALRSTLELGYRLFPLLERLPVAGKGSRYIAQAKMGLPDRLQSYNFLNRFAPEAVFDPNWLAMIEIEIPWELWRARYAEPEHADALQRMLYLDWKFTLADNDIVKVNQMCDLADIEVSYPMLDERVVNLACRLPSRILMLNYELRGFYKRACRDFLPEQILNKSKHGFGLPFGVWMKDDEGLRRLVAEALSGLRRRGIFRPDFLDDAERLYQREAPGYYGELAWILTVLELWFDAHVA